jgi:uncharacterized protein YmfQ (DUF2313 family)
VSRHYVNSAWQDYYAGRGGEVFPVDCGAVDDTFVIDTRDALSDPSVDALEPAGRALWPRGAAWGSPDGEAPEGGSVLAGLTRALLSGFADLYRRAWRILEESSTATLVDSLTDWETEFGLPDPCVTVPQSEDLRRRVLARRVRSLATITPADIVRLAAFLGYVVALEEPEAFKAGVSTCGDADEPSDTALEQQFVIHLHDVPTVDFETGIGAAGTDRLLDFDIGTLECFVRRIAPAWTYPIFSLAPVPTAFFIVTETGAALVTETGLRLIAPIRPTT